MALEKRIEQVRIDVAQDYMGDTIWAVQGEENSLQLRVELSQRGTPIDLEGVEITFKTRLVDGSIVRELIEGYDPELTNCFMHTLAKELFERDGNVECEVELRDTTNGITVKTPIFKLHVLASITE